MGDITLILQAIEQGDANAAEKLLPPIYDELRRLAAHKLADEKPGHTLQPTALVHEAWLRLMGSAPQPWNGRHHFFGAAARAMQRILVENARRKAAQRHGHGLTRVDLDQVDLAVSADSETLLRVNDALDLLAKDDAEAAELARLRYFVGLTIPEAGQALGLSIKQTNDLWAFARAALYDLLTKEG